MLYDLFICHASEDKDSFVRPLADALQASHAEVWYDEFSLELGDSIRRAIDRGLRQSRFGVVVLSPAFFRKRWPQYELDGLTEIEMRGNDKVLLPIWHNVGHREVIAYSPALANRKAIASDQGLDKVVAAILRVVKPQGSPLVEARDILLEWGVTPPVVTDPFWLEVVEASNRVEAFGAVVHEEQAWGRWTFPLPAKEGGPRQWGERLAWTAMQLGWSQAAEAGSVCPLTPPEEVLAFIDSQPGLHETCESFPGLLIEYAPQLTIPGSGGPFEELFVMLYEQSVARHVEMQKQGSTSGTGLTVDGQVPGCDEEWALRHPVYGGYSADLVACNYFSGGLFGPPVSPFNHTEHMVWLLSEASGWLPEHLHRVLARGMADWGVWLWESSHWGSPDAFVHAMHEAKLGKRFRWSPKRKQAVLRRFTAAVATLGLADAPEDLVDRFVHGDFINSWVSDGGTT